MRSIIKTIIRLSLFLEAFHDSNIYSGADGVMCAQGLLNNPALFAGYTETPLQCVQDWVNIAITYGTTFITFKHHLVFMLENVLPKHEKRIFNNLSTIAAVLDYLDNNFDIRYQNKLPT